LLTQETFANKQEPMNPDARVLYHLQGVIAKCRLHDFTEFYGNDFAQKAWDAAPLASCIHGIWVVQTVSCGGCPTTTTTRAALADASQLQEIISTSTVRSRSNDDNDGIAGSGDACSGVGPRLITAAGKVAAVEQKYDLRGRSYRHRFSKEVLDNTHAYASLSKAYPSTVSIFAATHVHSRPVMKTSSFFCVWVILDYNMCEYRGRPQSVRPP
jgi:hypothetical protein